MTHVLLAIPLGIVIGLSLGALGGGGSILTVPALVYVLGESAGKATTGSLVIVGSAALVGAVSHARERRVRWGPGFAVGVAGIPAAYAGSRLNTMVNPNVLLLAFAGLMVVAAAGLLWRQRSNRSAAAPDALRSVPRSRVATGVRVVGAGLVVGFLTGFFGVGGGFVIVPGLVFALGYPMATAAATSLLVIGINAVVSLIARAGHGAVDIAILVPFVLGAAGGALAGRQVTDRVSKRTLTRAFALLLLVIAAYVGVRAATSLGA
ncbi:MAG: sulfite exporter TauE/SafE family protein [Candidatus Dormibacteria bacterium]